MSDKTHVIMILITMLFLLMLSGAKAYEDVYKKSTKEYQTPLFVGLLICSFYWTEVLTRMYLNATIGN